MARWDSLSWIGSTSDGEFIMRSTPEPFLGKATISRILSVSSRTIKMRSKPGAAPACGGAPYLKAESMPRKRDSTYSLL